MTSTTPHPPVQRQIVLPFSKAVEIVKREGGKNEPLTKTLTAMTKMRTTLNAEIDNMSADDYIKGSRFLNQLTASVKLLQEPNAVNYFNGKWQASGGTVDELIYNQAQNEVVFIKYL